MKDLGIKEICCGSDHTLLFKESGGLYVFGDNSEGASPFFSQITLFDSFPQIIQANLELEILSVKSISPTILCYLLCLQNFSKTKQSLSFPLFLFFFSFESFLFVKPFLLMKDETIQKVACGGLFLRKNNKQKNFDQVSCETACHTVLLKTDSSVFVFGKFVLLEYVFHHSLTKQKKRNLYGQLGLGNNVAEKSPILLMKGEPIETIACGGLLQKQSSKIETFYSIPFKPITRQSLRKMGNFWSLEGTHSTPFTCLSC